MNILFRILLCLVACGPALLPLASQPSSSGVPLTLEEASQRMLRTNRSLQIAGQGVAIARNEYRRVAGNWWPTLQAEGAHVAMANDIGVDFTLLEHTFSFPIVRKRFTDVSLSVSWPLFAGGQRWWGTRMARRGITLAQLQQQGTESQLRTTLITTYYALYLAQRVEAVRRLSWQALERHYRDACRLEEEGMLTHADRLYARLRSDEAEREWQSSRRTVDVARQALCALLGEDEQTEFQPVTPIEVVRDLPDDSVWVERLMQSNIALQSIRVQSQVAKDRYRMAQSAYLPTIALIGRQSVYAYHLPKNLLPHAMIGVGFTWTLFDGLRREAGVREARLAEHTLTLTRGKTTDDLRLALFQQLSVLKDALSRIRSLHTAVALADELCRMRRQAFREGMATSTEVVDAEVMRAASEVALQEAEYAYATAWAALCSLTGYPVKPL